MTRYQRKLTLDARPEAVWQELSRFMQIGDICPAITKVDALTEGDIRVGAKRRCHFENGSNLVEQITEWTPGKGYRVQLQEVDPMPLKEAYADLHVEPAANGQSTVTWGMDYRVKFGPLGWLLGQTMMKLMMKGVLDGNLKGLEQKVMADKHAA